MNTYNGYTKDLPREEKLKNEIETLTMIDPVFYAARIAQIKSELRLMEKETCCCFEVMGDNAQCPKHGGMFKDHGPFTDADYRDDYRERDEIRSMAIGC